MATTKALVIGASGFPLEEVAITTYAGSGLAGRLVALSSNGKIDSSLVPASSGGGGAAVYTVRVDEVTIDLLYVGEAEAGSAEADPVWRIYRADFAGNSATKLYADGLSTFTKVWNDRASYTYF